MPSKYWENFADLSCDSSAESSYDPQELSEDVEEVELPQKQSRSLGNGNQNLKRDGTGDQDSNLDSDEQEDQNSKSETDGNGDQDLPYDLDEKQEERPVDRSANIGTVSRAMAANFRLPAIQPHEHASLFYLSLIEGRCRTQAAALINAGRPLENHVAENHPDVDVLASRLFAEMSNELLKAGMIPEEFIGRPLPELRLYLSSFDSILSNIVATTPQDLPELDSYRALDSDYNFSRAPRGSIATIASSEDSLEAFTANQPSQSLRSGSSRETQPHLVRAGSETRPSQPLRTGSAFESRPQPLRTGSAFDSQHQALHTESAFETRPFQALRTRSSLESRSAQLRRTGSATETFPSSLDDLAQRALTTTRYNSFHKPLFTAPFNPSRALVRGPAPGSAFDLPSYESAASANSIDFENSLSSSLEETGTDINSRALVLRNRSLNMSQSTRPPTPGPIPRLISLLSTGKDLSEISDPESIFETQYLIKKVLGSGGFGRVYKAEYYLDKAEVSSHVSLSRFSLTNFSVSMPSRRLSYLQTKSTSYSRLESWKRYSMKSKQWRSSIIHISSDIIIVG